MGQCSRSVAFAAVIVFASSFSSAFGQTETPESIFQSLHPHTGKMRIENGIAEVDVGTNFLFLDAADATTVLTKIMGNPLSAVRGNDGAILPTSAGESWIAVIDYSSEGHVSDSDAESINYDDLLNQIKESSREDAKRRRAEGFPGAEVLGWAQHPYYDPTSKKLFWAKSIKFDNQQDATLNYQIRILGRTGFVNITIVDTMAQLPKINAEMPRILSMVNFTPTNTYADYSPTTDHTAAYGIAGLIAGGVLTKAGFFKGLLVMAAAFWKLIAVAVLGFFASVGSFFRRIFRRRSAQ